MIAPPDPKLITLSWHTYRVLLAAYPRRFRQQYRQEMTLIFRDCSREVYRARGASGLALLWTRALLDLLHNVPKEYAMTILRRSDGRLAETRSCSACYSEVEPDWTVCKICGMVLLESTTHPSHAVVLEERFLNKLGHAVNAPLKLPD
jgi:hypothetical protein